VSREIFLRRRGNCTVARVRPGHRGPPPSGRGLPRVRVQSLPAQRVTSFRAAPLAEQGHTLCGRRAVLLQPAPTEFSFLSSLPRGRDAAAD
jgi:hypothetical protein